MYLLCVWSRCVGRRRLCSVCVGVRIPVHSSGVGYLVFTVSCVLFLVSLLAVLLSFEFVVYIMLGTVVMKQLLTACATAASL